MDAMLAGKAGRLSRQTRSFYSEKSVISMDASFIPPAVCEMQSHALSHLPTHEKYLKKEPREALSQFKSQPEASFDPHYACALFQCASRYGTDYSFNVNQVDNDFMPFRSMLAPSQTANAIGTDMPALNCTSLASPVSKVRLTTTRHVGPV